MTVTREPADRADADDTELAALEAAAEQAKADARRAAQAVRLARRSRAGRGTPVQPPAEPAEDDVAPTRVELTKPEPLAKATTSDAVAWTPDTASTDVEDEPVAPTEPASTSSTKPKSKAKSTSSTKPALDDAEDDDHLEASADESADTDDDAPKTRRRPRRVTVLATVFAVLAAVFVVIAAVVYANAQDTRTTSPAAARDAALVAARQDIVVLNTLDYNDVDGGLQRWLGATTGTLHDQLAQVSDADKQAIAVSKSVTTASVLAAAVTQVDAARGNATVIASVQIDVKPATGDPTSKRNRFSLTMTEVGDAWKISAVQQVPVTLT